MPAGLGPLMAVKGSIAVEGISLTVNEAGADAFAVTIIPHSWQHTNLAERQVGDPSTRGRHAGPLRRPRSSGRPGLAASAIAYLRAVRCASRRPPVAEPRPRSTCRARHLLIVEARYYAGVNDLLLAGARAVLAAAGAEASQLVVPGALGIPPAIAHRARAAATRRSWRWAA